MKSPAVAVYVWEKMFKSPAAVVWAELSVVPCDNDSIFIFFTRALNSVHVR